jgi:hypothetical protein
MELIHSIYIIDRLVGWLVGAGIMIVSRPDLHRKAFKIVKMHFC